ncbi:hypothetical protein MMUC44124_00390 [Mycolicibacterium mucogenicum DSM 44124]|nr:hypothetical protein MMUC44124_00390 [Mycolicibacterium mucogenicum DSM 44124]
MSLQQLGQLINFGVPPIQLKPGNEYLLSCS